MPTITVTQFTGTSFSEETFTAGLGNRSYVSHTSSTLSFVSSLDPAFTTVFQGSNFVVSNTGVPSAGDLASIAFYENGALIAEMGGINLDLAVFDSALEAANNDDFDAFDTLLAPFDIVFDASSVSNEEALFDDAFFELGDTAIAGAGGSYMQLGEFADTYIGGTGFDQISFANEDGSLGVVANLSTGNITDTYGNVETASGIFESLRGSLNGDTLIGNEVRNHLRGLDGNDVLDGQGGVDVVRYDRDASYGGFDGVLVDLEEGTAIDGFGSTDTLLNIEDVIGTNSDDQIFGNDAGNNLQGLDGNDRISGGEGDDTINPGDNNGYDVVELSAGNDTYIFSDGNLDNSYYEITVDPEPISITYDINGIANTGSITKGSFGTDTLVDVAVPLLAGANSGGLGIRGGAIGDVYNITNSTDVNHWIQVLHSEGDDTININSGTVRLSYFNTTSTVTANFETGVVLDSTGGTDTINGNAWEVQGGSGDDIFIGSDNNESFIGLFGNNTIDGGGGFDRARYDRFGIASVSVDLEAGTATTQWTSGATTIDSLTSIEWVRGSRDGADSLFGSAADERFQGRGGDDLFMGRGGDDEFLGEDGSDTVSYAEASGGVAVYLQISGLNVGSGEGRDTFVDIENLTGSSHGDRLIADANGNLLNGGDGNDLIKGKGGNDTFFGGAGDDTLRGDTGIDIMFGGADSDILVGLNGDDILSGDDGDDFLYGGRDNDSLQGGLGDDLLRGNRNNDELFGGSGSDRLFGGGNNDTLEGGADRDFLLGEGGNDRLDGGTGDDNLTGGTGVDVFVMASGYGYDRVLDFDNGVDTIDVTDFGLSGFGDINASQVASGVRITFGGGDTLLLQGEFLVSMDATDFIF